VKRVSIRRVDERARRIVETAAELAEKGGFEAVRLRDVAASSGVALGTLYRHFRSKEDLLIAAMAQQVEQLRGRMKAQPAVGDCALDRLGDFFTVATRGLCRRPMLARAILRATASAQPDLMEKVASFHGAITELISAAERGGHGVASGAPASDTAAVLEHVWFAYLVGWAAGIHEEQAVVSYVTRAAELMLGNGTLHD
jgi:AcrR family transcriptional regulator